MQSDRCFFVLVHADWWKTFSIARIGECLTSKQATRTLVCATAEFLRWAYFAVTLVYLLPEISFTHYDYYQVLSRRCISHQYDTLFRVVGRVGCMWGKYFILHIWSIACVTVYVKIVLLKMLIQPLSSEISFFNPSGVLKLVSKIILLSSLLPFILLCSVLWGDRKSCPYSA